MLIVNIYTNWIITQFTMAANYYGYILNFYVWMKKLIFLILVLRGVFSRTHGNFYEHNVSSKNIHCCSWSGLPFVLDSTYHYYRDVRYVPCGYVWEVQKIGAPEKSTSVHFLPHCDCFLCCAPKKHHPKLARRKKTPPNSQGEKRGGKRPCFKKTVMRFMAVSLAGVSAILIGECHSDGLIPDGYINSLI